MDEGVIYQCRNRLLKCTKSGQFPGILGLTSVADYLYVNDLLTVTDTGKILRLDDDGTLREAPLQVTDNKVRFIPVSAEWDVVDIIDIHSPSAAMEMPQISDTSYTSKTHKYLGDYLRWMKNNTSVNLMPLYNCYNKQSLDGWSIKGNKLVKDSSNSLVVVPIKFNQKYTISFDCGTPVHMTVAFLSDRLLKDSNKNLYLHEYIDNTFVTHGCLQSSEPVTYSVNSFQCVDDKVPYSKLVEFEQYLCLLIDVKYANPSSLVVIEGDFSSSSTVNCFDISAIYSGALSSNRLDESMVSQLSLLSNIDRSTYTPFSDKLVTYLLRYTIDPRDNITDNIARAEHSVNYISDNPGMWDIKLRYLLHQRYLSIYERYNLNKYDILGYVDADVEEASRKGLLK